MEKLDQLWVEKEKRGAGEIKEWKGQREKQRGGGKYKEVGLG